MGVHLHASMWRAQAGTGPMYGRSWGVQAARSPKQALLRCLILMWAEGFQTSTQCRRVAEERKMDERSAIVFLSHAIPPLDILQQLLAKVTRHTADGMQ